MNRKLFLRNALMTLAIAMLPKILQPMIPDIIEEEMVDVKINLVYFKYDNDVARRHLKSGVKAIAHEEGKWILRLPKSSAELFYSEYQKRKPTTLKETQ